MNPIDLTGVSCGLIPQIGANLRESGRERMEFLVDASKVTTIVNSLGIQSDWSLEVEENGDQALLRFRRTTSADDNPLDMF